MSDVKLPNAYLNSDDPTEGTCLALEPAGMVTPLRHELSNALVAQVYGRKTMKLIPSYDLNLLDADGKRLSPINAFAPDLVKHPQFQQATALEVTLEPGEMLFLPVGWWHAEQTSDVNITLVFTNFAFPNGFSSAPPKHLPSATTLDRLPGLPPSWKSAGTSAGHEVVRGSSE